jgi:hypothetical protein
LPLSSGGATFLTFYQFDLQLKTSYVIDRQDESIWNIQWDIFSWHAGSG